MPFTSFSTREEVAQAFQISMEGENFLTPMPFKISDYLRLEMDFVKRRVAFGSSEFAVCENLIYPVLKEVWKAYADDFQLWSHVPLDFNEVLSGTPDYLLARRSPLGTLVRDKPYLLVVEAKKDDFERGWAQCLAALLAAQRLNDLPEQVLYGITTNGRTWAFAKLEGNRFTENWQTFDLFDLDQLCAYLNQVFHLCRQQLVAALAH